MSAMPECWAIIPAAGIGQRMASSVPKQYLQILGKSILEHAMRALLDSVQIKQVVLALNANDDYFPRLQFTDVRQKIHTVIGGETRAHSVLNALLAIKPTIGPNDFVLVHDAARPCLSDLDLQALIETCLQHDVGGILAARATDTIKQVQQSEIISTLERSNIWRAFTPQMFKFNILYNAIRRALEDGVDVTDESSAVEYVGYHPCVVEGSVRNIKVTYPEDMAIAEMYLSKRKL